MKASQPRMLQRATLAAGFALACAGAPPTEQSPLSRANSSLADGDTATADRTAQTPAAEAGAPAPDDEVGHRRCPLFAALVFR